MLIIQVELGLSLLQRAGKACQSASQELVVALSVFLCTGHSTEGAKWEQLAVAGNLQAAGSGSQLSVHLTL